MNQSEAEKLLNVWRELITIRDSWENYIPTLGGTEQFESKLKELASQLPEGYSLGVSLAIETDVPIAPIVGGEATFSSIYQQNGEVKQIEQISGIAEFGAPIPASLEVEFHLIKGNAAEFTGGSYQVEGAIVDGFGVTSPSSAGVLAGLGTLGSFLFNDPYARNTEMMNDVFADAANGTSLYLVRGSDLAFGAEYGVSRLKSISSTEDLSNLSELSFGSNDEFLWVYKDGDFLTRNFTSEGSVDWSQVERFDLTSQVNDTISSYNLDTTDANQFIVPGSDGLPSVYGLQDVGGGYSFYNLPDSTFDFSSVWDNGGPDLNREPVVITTNFIDAGNTPIPVQHEIDWESGVLWEVPQGEIYDTSDIKAFIIEPSQSNPGTAQTISADYISDLNVSGDGEFGVPIWLQDKDDSHREDTSLEDLVKKDAIGLEEGPNTYFKAADKGIAKGGIAVVPGATVQTSNGVVSLAEHARQVKQASALSYVPEGAIIQKFSVGADGVHYVRFVQADGAIGIMEGYDTTGDNRIDFVKESLNLLPAFPGAGYSALNQEKTYVDGVLVERHVEDIEFDNSVIKGENIGRIFGSQIGSYIAGDNVFAQIGASTLIGTIGQNLGEFIHKGSHLSSSSLLDSQGDRLTDTPLSDAAEITFSDFGQDLVNNLQVNVISSLSSFLVAELGEELDLEGFGAGVFTVAANTVTNQFLTNIANVAQGVEGVDLFSGLDFETLGGNLAGSFGSFFGGALADEIVMAESQEAALFGSIAASVGSYIGSVVFSAIPFIGPFIGSFIGKVLGTLIGNLFFDEDPYAVARAAYNSELNQFEIVFSEVDDGGNLQLALDMANSHNGIVNSYLDRLDGDIRSRPDFDEALLSVGAQNSGDLELGRSSKNVMGGVFGHDEDALFAQDMRGQDASSLIKSAATNTLSSFWALGGDALIRRAFNKSEATTLTALDGDLKVAEDYRFYLDNTALINTLIAEQPNSLLAAGWIATLARAQELGLNVAWEFDYVGGFTPILEQANISEYVSWIPGFDGDNLVLTNPDNPDEQVRVDNFFGPGAQSFSEGTAGDDQLTFSDLNLHTVNQINAGAGNDEVTGHKGTDLIVAGDGDDVANGGDGVDWLYGGSGKDELNGGAGDDTIVGGTGDDLLKGGSGSDDLHGGAWDDRLYGDEGNDILAGDEGYDRLYGGRGDDTYVYNRGDGHDTIFNAVDNQASDVDILRFGKGISQQDIRLSIEGRDLIFTILGTDGGSVRVEDYVGSGMIDGVEFSNGSWSGSYLRHLIAGGSSQDDTIVGSRSDEDVVFYGGRGNDHIETGFLAENNRIFFGFGDGQDILDIGRNFSSDEVIFTNGVKPSDVSISHEGNSLILSLSDGSSLKVLSFFSWLAREERVEKFIFQDGTEWDFEYINERIISEQQTSGNDTITGFYGVNETFEAGAGDDYLEGGYGGETYIYNLGDGNDTIYDNGGVPVIGSVNEGDDTIHFGSGISREDVSFDFISDEDNTVLIDLLITILPTQETIRVKRHFGPSITDDDNVIEYFKFSDGTVLTHNDVYELIFDQQQTAGDDLVLGTGYRSDVFEGGKGDDILMGDFDADTYIYNLGDGNDIIIDALENDNILKLGDGITVDNITMEVVLDPPIITAPGQTQVETNDVLITFSDGGSIYLTDQLYEGYLRRGNIKKLEFADGRVWSWEEINSYARNFPGQDDTIIGTSDGDVLNGGLGSDYIFGSIGDDVIAGGSGEDHLNGGSGNDTYKYDLGDGHDYISNHSDNNYNEIDTLQFDNGINPDYLSVRTENTDIIFEYSAELFDNNGNPFDPPQFETPYKIITLKKAYGSSAIDRVVFDGYPDVIWTRQDLLKKATLSSDGNDTIDGNSGFEVDLLYGGKGNDLLGGLSGDDVYHFELGDGVDRITDRGGAFSRGEVDQLVLGHGILPEHIRLERDPDNKHDLLVHVGNDGDLVKVTSFFWSTSSAIENIVFENGITWNRSAILGMISDIESTDGNDVIYGSREEGNHLSGLKGDDYLDGGYGSDFYYFNLGDGIDRINDRGASSQYEDEFDRIILGEGITPDSISFALSDIDENDLRLIIGTNGDEIILDNQLADYSYTANIEYVQFADGTVWDIQAIEENYLNSLHTDGSDIIKSFGNNTSFYNSLGDDQFIGGYGSDRYYYNLGDGFDQIFDRGSSSGTSYGSDHDRLILSEGIEANSITVTRSKIDIDDVTISYRGQELVSLDEQFYDNRNGIEYIHFASGLVWTSSDLKAQSLIGRDGDDDLLGFSGQDILDGKAGNDILRGEGGSDTYIFDRGYGHDSIIETNFSDRETVKLGASIGVNDVEFSQDLNNSDHLVLTIIDTQETLTIHNYFMDLMLSINFENGIRYSRSDVLDLINLGQVNGSSTIGTSEDDELPGTNSNDIIVGLEGNDILSGGLGNDNLSGGVGNDTYRYQSGDGNDVIIETSETNAIDRLELLDLNPQNIEVLRDQNDQSTLIIKLLVSGETITIKNQIDGQHTAIEEIVFADNTVWSANDLLFHSKLLIEGNSSNEILTGSNFSDVIDGKEGNDTLEGYGGNDTYLFKSGDGNDIIDNRGSEGDIDRVILSDSLSADVILSRDPENLNDIVIQFVNSSDSIRLLDQLTGTGVNEIEFSDGEIWSEEQINNSASLVGTAENDEIIGSEFSDIISSSAGDDILKGGAGSDFYHFGFGSGNDQIEEQNLDVNDTIVLGENITQENLVLSRGLDNPFDLLITLSDSNETLLVKNHFRDPAFGINAILFTDGLTWDFSEIQTRVTGIEFGDVTHNGSSSNDVILGTGYGDVLNGQLGNDTLQGSYGSDTYQFASGQGNDVVLEFGAEADIDKVKLQGLNPEDITVSQGGESDLDLIITVNLTGETLTISQHFISTKTGIEAIEFGNNVIWNLEQINQALNDNNDSPFVVQALGDQLIFIDDIWSFTIPENIFSDADSHDLTYTAQLSDGGALPNWLSFDALTKTFSGTPTTDFVGELLISVFASDGEFFASSDFRLTVDPENDTPVVSVLLPDQTITEDQSFDFSIAEGTFTDVDSQYLTLSAKLSDGSNLPEWITFDSVTRSFSGQPPQNYFGTLDLVVFASDGNSEVSDAFQLIITPENDAPILLTDITDQSITENDDWSFIVPEATFSDIDGDGLQYTAVLTDGSVLPSWLSFDADTREFSGKPPVGSYGELSFRVIASDGSLEVSDNFTLTIDELITPATDDTFTGSSAAENYYYYSGDGNDTISEYLYSSATDRLYFNDLNMDDVTFSIDHSDLDDVLIRVNDTGEIITLNEQLYTANAGIEEIIFADGSVLLTDRPAMRELAKLLGTDGDDTIEGNNSRNVFEGGLGDDRLYGEDGADSYYYSSGDGNDFISEDRFNSSTDQLIFRDLNMDDVSFSIDQTDLDDVFITVNGTGEVIELDEQLYTANAGVEEIIFADGTVFNASISALNDLISA